MTPVTAAPANSGNSLASLSLLIGQTIRARVLSVIDDTMARILLPGGSTLDIETEAPLAAGTTATLSVEGTPAQPRLIVATLDDNTAAASQPSSGTGRNASVSAATSLVRDLAARQNGLPALFADLEALTATNDPSIPKAVTTALGNLLAARLDLQTGAAPDATDIQTALLRAGLDDASANAPALRNGPTTAAALTTLRQSLQTWLAAETEPLEQLSANGTVTAQRNPAARDNVPPPPYRGAPTVAQSPVASSIAGDVTLRERVLHLMQQTDATIARRALLQVASSPMDRAAVKQTKPQQPVTVLLEIPLATNEGTAAAQIRISRDARGQNDPSAGPAWHIDFSTVFEPLGPVHTHIALAGTRTTVTLNAERSESAALLSTNLVLLDAALRNAELEPGSIRCRAATSRAANASPGTFLDQAT
jgi:hypothetical protein